MDAADGFTYAGHDPTTRGTSPAPAGTQRGAAYPPHRADAARRTHTAAWAGLVASSIRSHATQPDHATEPARDPNRTACILTAHLTARAQLPHLAPPRHQHPTGLPTEPPPPTQSPPVPPGSRRPLPARALMAPNPKRRKARRGVEAIEDITQMALEQGLLGPLGVDYSPTSENPLFASLLSDLSSRAYKATDIPRLRSALPWFGSFVTESGRVPFIPAFGATKMEGQVYNRCTLDAFGEYLRQSTPRGWTARGHLSAQCIDGYVSAIRLFRSREARYEIAEPDDSMVGPLLRKMMRKEDGPAGSRAKNTGLRAQNMRDAARNKFPRDGVTNAVRWAAATTGLNLVLRGGEIGITDSADIDLSRIITWRSILWQSPCEESKWRPWFIMRVVPIKDQKGNGKAYPCCVCRQHDGRFDTNPTDPYDAVAKAWWIRSRPGLPLPLDEDGLPHPQWFQAAPIPDPIPNDVLPTESEAFFSHPNGEPLTTSDVCALGKAIARYAGIDPKHVGAKCFRIGGATDWRAAEGPGATGRVLKMRGRWATDCGEIYSRPLVAEQLHFSVRAGEASGNDLEALCADFAQRRFT